VRKLITLAAATVLMAATAVRSVGHAGRRSRQRIGEDPVPRLEYVLRARQ